MSVVRKNILTDTVARNQYIRGVNLLKQESSGFMTNQFGIAGPSVAVSTYDLFVIWHHQTMMQLTPPGNSSGRNAAHRGPIFLPWHRIMLMLFESNLQRALADNKFGLPYWDWMIDGDLPPASQTSSALWAAACMGGTGAPVSTGPFAFNSSNAASWRVRIAGNSAGDLVSVNRGLRRNLANDPIASDLPSTSQGAAARLLTTYDASPWDTSTNGFRNRLEGWINPDAPFEPGMHNRVHVWVGGDMSPTTSPNDPVFYFNHCNVDRNWESWLSTQGRNYLPDMTASTSLRGQRLNDPIASPLSSTVSTASQVLDVSTIYSYDTLP